MGAETAQPARTFRENASPNSRRRAGSQASPQPRTKRLERLRTQAAKLYEKAFGSRKAANHEDAANRWRVVTDEIRALETSFVLCQGQEIDAQVVNFIDGDFTTSTAKDFNGREELLRDQAGRYYLRQRVDFIFPTGSHEFNDRIKASERTRVHRVSLNAAILWAATRLNSVTLDLRNDAASLIMENRGYFDPEERAAGWSQAQVQALAGSGQPLCSPGTTGHRVTIELDALASAMLTKNVLRGSSTKQAGEDPRDLVNAAVTFYLCDENDDKAGSFNLEMDDEALARAKQDRLALENRAPETITVPEPEATTDEDGLTHLVFEYPATKDCGGGRMQIAVSDGQMAEAERLAAHFGIGARQFLALVTTHALPDQPPAGDAMEELLDAGHVSFACADKKLFRRIRRAAKASDQSIEGFVAAAVAGHVDSYEENMIIHPRTGRLLHAAADELYTREGYRMTTAPISQEHEPQWQRTLHRRHVQFSAHLTAEQLERLEYPHLITDCATDRELPCVLIPYDAEEGLPYLTVSSRDVAPSQPVPDAAPHETLPVHVALASMAACLDVHVFGLLCSYLGENPEDDPRDVVNGYLASMLACDLHGTSESGGEALEAARARRLAHEASRGHNMATAMIPVFTSAELSRLGRAGLAVSVASRAAKGAA